MGRDRRVGGVVAVCWALLGVVLVLATSIVQLGARGIATVRNGLDPAEWLALAVLIALFVYGEGVRGLQRRWVPAVLRRIAELPATRRAWYRLLAPLYAMLLVGAPKRTLGRAWAGVAAIVAAVLVVRSLPEPWRGMTDLAVAAALAWGLIAVLAGVARLAAGTPPARRAGAGRR